LQEAFQEAQNLANNSSHAELSSLHLFYELLQ
jgi:hypothetical protein